MRAVRRLAAPDAGAVRSSFPMAAAGGDRAGAVAAASAAAFPEAAGGRAAAERRGVGDGVHQRTARGRFGPPHDNRICPELLARFAAQ